MTSAPAGEGTSARAHAGATDVSALLAERYGRSADQEGRSRRQMWMVAAACTAAGLVVLVLISITLLRPAATARDVGFAVPDEAQVRVIFDVTKPADRSAVCTVEALNTGFGQVGLLDVVIPPSDGPTTRHTVAVATTELATTGVVRECALLD
ncbi:DUF4307 domain-containing protein [Ruania halotolerans]|uniref:DUF4307 domain-containing protein n=1 Tax=Ruania halotolerans TaxID=2897773 RepID=UPI001E3C1731|nr:DUF4307 domain-containing protein [Ruania halotolerans]UFU07447.1 DUF4307 domain-containing protein [Ruania halotolerans]